jgi:hypothetical protein
MEFASRNLDYSMRSDVIGLFSDPALSISVDEVEYMVVFISMRREFTAWMNLSQCHLDISQSFRD